MRERRSRRWWIGILLAGLIGCSAGEREVLAHHPDGTPSSSAHEVRVEDGGWVREGAYRAWHADGRLAEEGEFRAGLESGPWIRWHANGVLRERGAYLWGEKEGEWIHRFPHGAIDRELTGLYGEGVKIDDLLVDGNRTEWFDEGRPRVRHAYAKGVRHGPAAAWYADGTKRFEGHYDRGRKARRWTYWNPDGSIDAARSGRYEGWRRLED